MRKHEEKTVRIEKKCFKLNAFMLALCPRIPACPALTACGSNRLEIPKATPPVIIAAIIANILRIVYFISRTI
ncbi:MAG: hypothetical protein WCF23_24030 [Candidatus Nitrosopolaris sp.]